jgi:hypothetical protein
LEILLGHKFGGDFLILLHAVNEQSSQRLADYLAPSIEACVSSLSGGWSCVCLRHPPSPGDASEKKGFGAAAAQFHR